MSRTMHILRHFDFCQSENIYYQIECFDKEASLKSEEFYLKFEWIPSLTVLNKEYYKAEDS